jgi:hypothetical protein
MLRLRRWYGKAKMAPKKGKRQSLIEKVDVLSSELVASTVARKALVGSKKNSVNKFFYYKFIFL